MVPSALSVPMVTVASPAAMGTRLSALTEAAEKPFEVRYFIFLARSTGERADTPSCAKSEVETATVPLMATEEIATVVVVVPVQVVVAPQPIINPIKASTPSIKTSATHFFVSFISFVSFHPFLFFRRTGLPENRTPEIIYPIKYVK